MSKAAMNEEMFRQASALRDEGRPWQDIAKAVGYSGSGNAMQKLFTRTMARFGPGKQAASKPLPGIKQALGEMRQAASRANETRAKVVSEWDEDVDLQELWSKAERDSEKRIAKAHKHSRFNTSLPGDRVSCITFMSDQHIAPGSPCDFKRMREDAELVAATKDVHVILGGDCIDGHIKHLAAVIGARSTPGDQWQLFEYYLNILKDRVMVAVAGNHDCLDLKTELLTKRGWISILEAKQDDMVLGINRETETAEWQPIGQIITSQYSGKMREVKTGRISLSCTPNHRILHKQWKRPGDQSGVPYRFMFAEESVGSRICVPTAISSGNSEYDLPDDMIRLCGMILTDGHLIKSPNGRTTAYGITQRKSKVQFIFDLLESTGLEYNVRYRDRDITEICGKILKKPPETSCEIYIKAESCGQLKELIPTKDHLPPWIGQLSDRQFNVLIEAMIEGDGSWATGSDNSAVIHKSKRFLDQLQVHCITHKWAASIVEYRPETFRMNLCKNSMHVLYIDDKTNWVDYEGLIWCLRVPHENFMIRRNGKCHFTGNSWVAQYAGIDVMSNLCKSHKIAYSSDEARIDVTCGSQKYKVAMRHQYRLNSSFNQTHSVKQWLRLGEDEFDIGCIGHHHEAAVEQTIYRGKMVWGCRPGAYQITSAYSAQYGWNMSIPTCPSFLVFPDRRHIIGLADVRDVPTILRAFNG